MTQLHLKHYIYILVSLSALLFFVFGFTIHTKLLSLDDYISYNSTEAAHGEFDNAIDNLKIRIDTLAKDIADWDEVHQQIRNPKYYDYWKAQRLTGANLPDYLSALEIFDELNRPLSASSDIDPPTDLATQASYFYADNDRIFYIRFYPVNSRTRISRIIGYIGIKVDLIKSLLGTSRFVFIDEDSIGISKLLKPRIIRDDISDYLEFSPVANPVFSEMRKLVYSTMQFAALMVALFIIVLYTLIRVTISKPISQLSGYVDKLKLGKKSRVPLGVLPIFELENLRKSLDAYQNELASAYRSLDVKNDELWQLAHHDPLTGIANRRAFDKDWKSHLAIAADRRIDISLMLIDCDHFKAINDTYGHDIGDLLIKQLSTLLQASIREGDRLYRTGGDEFVTILWETDRETAQQIAERCLKSIRNQRFDALGIKEPISISIGISHKGTDMENGLEELPRQADIAMYHAKKSGNPNIVHYDASLEKDIAPLVSNRILDAVIKAAESGQGIVMYYQPVIDTRTERVEYFEALIRIEDRMGVISPGEIFSVVERLSLEAEIDIAIIRRVIEDVEARRLPENTGISINLSSTSLTMPDLAQHLAPLRNHMDLHPCILEVTENTLIGNINSASLKLSELRQQGFKVALDDFGSGYSSIRYLASMPIDIVKFDISMIRQLAEEGTESVISGTAQVILNSGYRLVAEGIEDEAVRQLVMSMGATHLQGYLLGRPLPVAELRHVASC